MKSVHGFFKLAVCNLILFGCLSCSPAVVQTSSPVTSTVPTFTLAPPTATVDLSSVWSATPDILSTLPPPESNTVWSSTPGWLTPPTLIFTPSDTPTATIIFDTPKPGQVQGVRGTVVVSGGPAPENGSRPTSYPSCCISILARDPVTDQIMATTESGADGVYELQLLPGRYNICASAYGSDDCTNNVIITAGNFLTIDLGVAMP